MENLIPLIAGLLNRAGGTDQWKWCPINQKWWRWFGIGAVVAIVYHSWLPLLTYYLAVNIPYGEKSPLNFLGEYGKFAVCGFAFGLASAVVIGMFYGIISGIIGAISWIMIKYFDDRGEIVNPWTELARGFCGTLVYWIT